MNEEVWIPIIALLAIAGTIISYFYFTNQTKESLHKAVRDAMEKGVDLSPEIIKSLAKPSFSKYGDLRKGVLFTAFGVATLLFGYLVERSDPDVMGLSMFPIAIGIGYFVIARITNGGAEGS